MFYSEWLICIRSIVTLLNSVSKFKDSLQLLTISNYITVITLFLEAVTTKQMSYTLTECLEPRVLCTDNSKNLAILMYCLFVKRRPTKIADKIIWNKHCYLNLAQISSFIDNKLSSFVTKLNLVILSQILGGWTHLELFTSTISRWSTYTVQHHREPIVAEWHYRQFSCSSDVYIYVYTC